MSNQKTINVPLGERSYDVRVGAGLLDTLGKTASAMPDVRQVAVISDSNVAKLYGQRALNSLAGAGLDANLIEFSAGEVNKTLSTTSDLYDRLFALEPAIDRDLLIVALGGGVTGDMAGFVAATTLRGVRWLQCPTTLLADVDASVGGKTGVDHAAGKNLIGAFYQPGGVLIDVETLKTLPEIELRSGLAECIKHAVIRDASLLEFIETNVDPIAACDCGVMTELVARNVAVKAAVVAADEKEAGERAHLNFGHTVGHGIEAFIGYGQITHGQAVALGMLAACDIAAEMGLVDSSVRDRIAAVLEKVGLATSWSGLDVEAIWSIMQHDKKAKAGRVRFVLPTKLGEVEIHDDVTPAQVAASIERLA